MLHVHSFHGTMAVLSSSMEKRQYIFVQDDCLEHRCLAICVLTSHTHKLKPDTAIVQCHRHVL